MWHTKKIQEKLHDIYAPGISAELLASEGGCDLYQAHRYLAERIFEDDVSELHEGGLSLRQIADELDANHMTVRRALLQAKSRAGKRS